MEQMKVQWERKPRYTIQNVKDGTGDVKTRDLKTYEKKTCQRYFLFLGRQLTSNNFLIQTSANTTPNFKRNVLQLNNAALTQDTKECVFDSLAKTKTGLIFSLICITMYRKQLSKELHCETGRPRTIY